MATAYTLNGQAVDATTFTHTACNPYHSVVVEACAGSGKTWLLVGRMLRLLLAGAKPSELLAITFTKKAAQEMQERLMALLESLALVSDEEAMTLLRERGVAEQDMATQLPIARALYERILSSDQHVSIDTFHSWFIRLLQLAPLASGVPHGYSLAEQTSDLIHDAFIRLLQLVQKAEQQPLKEALLSLYDQLGDSSTHDLLHTFMDKRAEWWASTQLEDHDVDTPVNWLMDLCGEDAVRDARLSLWSDVVLKDRVLTIARLLGQGTDANQKTAVEIESGVTDGASLDNFNRLKDQFCTQAGKPRSAKSNKALKVALDSHFEGDAESAFKDEFTAIAEALLTLEARSAEMQVMAMNKALFTVGDAFIRLYQEIKAEQRIVDFTDLEWQVYRLLLNEEHAAYLQVRLDARYKHILLDEFQDTNPIQWSVIQSWLNAYSEEWPSMFVVGDPKQSIYRFRRAEPRVFAAARELLAAHGAQILQANQTRRNATAIVEVLNTSFAGENLFSPQTTLGLNGGAVWRLPLIQTAVEDDVVEENALRLPLETALVEDEDERRLEEGRQLAQVLHHLKHHLSVGERLMQWQDVMILVRKRTHLSAYETAFREANIPFLSDRRGGLLDSLEIADLMALLTFCVTPHDNRALAHVLKSPIIGASDQDLMQIAQQEEGFWWERLNKMRQENALSFELLYAVDILNKWIKHAQYLPVHDFLDQVVHQGELMQRYAQYATALNREQVLGNIEAFLGMSLEIDAGRYPSLPKFLEALHLLQNQAESDAPNAASIDVTTDAVCMMTVHSAKGLEAPVVVLLDTNHSEGKTDHMGILCHWPEDSVYPDHFSAFAKKETRGFARTPLFDEEDQFRAQEDLNLLYVAITRAKQLCIVSGIADKRSGDVKEGSWYARVRGDVLEEIDPQTLPEQTRDTEIVSGTFDLSVFKPQSRPNPEKPIAAYSSAEIEEGVILHGLLERLAMQGQWPIVLPEIAQVQTWMRCDEMQANIALAQLTQLNLNAELARFFDQQSFVTAQNEMTLVAKGKHLRCDRVVFFEEEIWILDYKRRYLLSEKAAYQGQLNEYRAILSAIYPDKSIHCALITSEGSLVEV